MNYKFLPLFILSILFFKTFDFTTKRQISKYNFSKENIGETKVASKTTLSLESKCELFYNEIELNNFSLPNFESFSKAFMGYEQLLHLGKVENEILTIVDFSLSSKQERMWVIDMKTKQILLQTLVAHGRNSGLEFANNFSNQSESYQSSLGFYVTGEQYLGKHGKSLRLDGIEFGINNNARSRAIVIHGADYVSRDFIAQHGRLGRSQGCPAVPHALNDELINIIKDKSVLFIYHPSQNYFKISKLVS